MGRFSGCVSQNGLVNDFSAIGHLVLESYIFDQDILLKNCDCYNMINVIY